MSVKIGKIPFQVLIFALILILCSNLKLHLQSSQHKKATEHQISHKKPLASQKQHKYYNLQQTNRVSQSRSIKYLNQCKALCLSMHELFPFQFKYHRVVYRQTQGEMKYITGQCLYAFRKQQPNKAQQHNDAHGQNSPQPERKWLKWSKLREFLDMAVVQDEAYARQKEAWQSYTKDCEDESLKLSQSSIMEFKLTMVHSDFQYYENDGFKNLQPFDDFNGLLSSLPAV